MAVLEARHVYKVFGERARAAAEALAQEGRAEAAAGSAADSDVTSQVAQRFGVVPAVIDADFAVEAGEIFVVMGLSGSGKSTLIRTLNGLHPVTSGEVVVQGQSLTNIPAARLRDVRRKHISMVFQHFALLPHRTVLENAAYGLQLKGVGEKERTARATEAIDLVGLKGWGGKRPDQLSGGMQQRVGLARALAADTDIILMDEAFSALDPLIRREMQDQLVDLQKRLGKTIVFITHDLNEAMRLGDRIAMMHSGRIVQIGSAYEILSRPATEYVARFIADVDRSRVLTASSIMAPPPARDAGDPGVAPGTLLASLFGRAARTEVPLPVRDEAGTLLGVVTRDRLLAAMDERPGATLRVDSADLAETGTLPVYRPTSDDPQTQRAPREDRRA